MKQQFNKIKDIMKNNQKQLIVLGSLVLVFMVVCLIGRSVADPNSGYLRNQSVDGLSFEDASLVYENGISTYTVEVYNETGSVYSLKNISINLKSESGDITTLVGYIGGSLDKDEAKLITASIDQDLSSTLNIEYVVNK